MKKITINENGLLKINLGFLGDNYKNLKKTVCCYKSEIDSKPTLREDAAPSCTAPTEINVTGCVRPDPSTHPS